MTAADLAILPVLVPTLTAPLALLAMRRHRPFGIAISVAGCLAMLAAVLALAQLSHVAQRATRAAERAGGEERP